MHQSPETHLEGLHPARAVSTATIPYWFASLKLCGPVAQSDRDEATWPESIDELAKDPQAVAGWNVHPDGAGRTSSRIGVRWRAPGAKLEPSDPCSRMKPGRGIPHGRRWLDSHYIIAFTSEPSCIATAAGANFQHASRAR